MMYYGLAWFSSVCLTPPFHKAILLWCRPTLSRPTTRDCRELCAIRHIDISRQLAIGVITLSLSQSP
jgi:hypothetical protein